jgi:hypothetical protein
MHTMLASGVGQNRTGLAFGLKLTTWKRHVREHMPKPEGDAPLGGGLDTSVDPSTLGEAWKRIHLLAEQADALMKKAKSGSLREQAACLTAARGTLDLRASRHREHPNRCIVNTCAAAS